MGIAIRPTLRSCTRLDDLEDLYSVRDAATVWQFLLAHLHLVEVLLEAYPHLEKHFGPDPEVTLEVVNDPEAVTRKQVFAYIVTSFPPAKALTRLDKLDEEWFLDQLDRVDGLLNFNLESR
ncbi:MAG: hypothetical protein ACE5LU_17645 [Anaerolineae bacterium]